MIAAYTGQRATDIMKMTWAQYDGNKISVTQQKTGAKVKVRCMSELKSLLDETPKESINIVISENTKRPYNQDHLSKSFAKIRKKAGINQKLMLRDLRRTAVVNLFRAGCTVPEVASITGHSVNTCQKIIDTYFPKDEVAADNAIKKLEDYRSKNSK